MSTETQASPAPTPITIAPTSVQSEAEEIVNAPRIVPAFGRSYEIRRFTLGPAFRAAEFVAPFGFLFKTIMKFPQEKDDKGRIRIKATQDEFIELAVTAISISGPSAIGLISIATGEPIEWLEDKDPFDGLDILAAILEKNIDFFTPENIERVTKMFGGLQRAILAYGGATSTT